MSENVDHRRPGYSNFLRFCSAGAIGFVVDGGLTQALVSLLQFDVLVARLLSFSVAVTITWLINRRFTFPHRPADRLSRQWLCYAAVNGVGAGLNLLVYSALVLSLPYMARFPIYAVAIAASIAMGVNYWSSSKLVFTAKSADRK